MNTLNWSEFSISNINRGHVSEHAPAGQRVGSIARNRTTGSTFSIASSGNTGGGRFAVDSASGVVTVLAGATFNFASEPTILVDFVETLSGTSNTTTLTINVKPNFGTSAAAVAWDAMDRCATNVPPTVGATTITGLAKFNAAQNIRSNYGYAAANSTAKVYLEHTIGAMTSPGPYFGLCSISHAVAGLAIPGRDDSFGIALRADGYCWANGVLLTGTNIPGMSFTTGDVVMVACDTGTGKIWLGKNGVWALSGNPASGANPMATLALDDFYAWAAPSNDDTVTANWGDTAFVYAVPTGFASYKSGNPAPAGSVVSVAAALSATTVVTATLNDITIQLQSLTNSSSDLTAASSLLIPLTSPLAATSNTSFNAVDISPLNANLNSTTILAANTSDVINLTAPLTSSSVFTIDGSGQTNISTSLTASVALTAAALQIGVVRASLNATALLSSSARAYSPAAAIFTTSSYLVADGRDLLTIGSDIHSSSSISASPSLNGAPTTYNAASIITATTRLSSSIVNINYTNAALNSNADSIAGCATISTVACLSNATTELLANIGAINNVSAHINSVSAFNATQNAPEPVTAPLQASSTLDSTISVVTPVASSNQAATAFDNLAIAIVSMGASLNSNTLVSMQETSVVNLVTNATGTAQIAANPIITSPSITNLYSNSHVSAQTIATMLYNSSLNSVCTLEASALRVRVKRPLREVRWL